jgi:hypothetical protein
MQNNFRLLVAREDKRSKADFKAARTRCSGCQKKGEGYRKKQGYSLQFNKAFEI